MTEKEFNKRFLKCIKDNVTSLNSAHISKGFSLATMSRSQFPALALKCTHTYREIQNNELVRQDLSLIVAVRSWRDVYGSDGLEAIQDLKEEFRSSGMLRIYGLYNELGADLQQCFIVMSDDTEMEDVAVEGGMVYMMTFFFSAEYDTTP